MVILNCLALWLGHFGHSGHLGRHMLPYMSVAFNVRPLKLKTCSTHKNGFSNMSLYLFLDK